MSNFQHAHTLNPSDARREHHYRSEPLTTHCVELPVLEDFSHEDERDFDLRSLRTISAMQLIELVLKNQQRLNAVARSAAVQPTLITRCLMLSLVSSLLFGISMSLMFQAAGQWPQLAAIHDVIDGRAASLLMFADHSTPVSLSTPVPRGSTWAMALAYILGPTAALGVCLPSLYFYGLLTGIRMRMLDVVSHALKAQAVTSIALVGILPIYAAVGMAVCIFQLPSPLAHWALWLGLLLPFIAGLWGTHSLYIGFAGLCDTMAAEFRSRRECFLRRLVLSWAACYTAVAPVMIFTIWQRLA